MQRGKNHYPGRRLIAPTAALVISTGLAACSSAANHNPSDSVSAASSTESGSATSESDSGNSNTPASKIGRVSLNRSNYCVWGPNNPEPLVARNKIQIDGRCNPHQSNKLHQVGVYSEPIQMPQGLIYNARNRQVLRVVSIAAGEDIVDANNHRSNIWLKVDTPVGYGYVPESTTGWDGLVLLQQGVPVDSTP